jgi:hypothetical protein
VHVPHRHRQVGVAGQILDGLGRRAGHGQVGAEAVPQDVDAAGHRQPGPTLGLLHPVADHLVGELATASATSIRSGNGTRRHQTMATSRFRRRLR